ncbi:MAG: ABC transporter permease [Syntrophothermus sp.]
MGEYVKIAFRNILRHKRRSLFTGLGMLVGAFVLTFGQAYNDGVQHQLFSTMIAADTGHILFTVRKETGKGGDFEESMGQVTNWKLLIKDPAAIDEVLANQPDIRQVSGQITINGMISNGSKMFPGLITGIEPGKERDLLERVMPADRGSNLSDDDPYGIYISHTTAARFGVQPGDSLTLVAQTADGGINALDFLVKGIFKKNAPWREYNSFINLSSAQELAMVGDGVTQIKVMLRDAGLAKTQAAALRRVMPEKFNLEIRDWEEAGGFYAGMILQNRILVAVLYLVLFIVVAASVMNTMLMAVYERTREIGTMRAMGTARRQIVGLFLLEAVLLGLFAAGLGVILAGALSLWLGHVGIPAFVEAMRYAYGADRAYPYLTGANVLFSYLTVVLLAAVASFYPALKASRLKPVEALTYV